MILQHRYETAEQHLRSCMQHEAFLRVYALTDYSGKDWSDKVATAAMRVAVLRIEVDDLIKEMDKVIEQNKAMRMTHAGGDDGIPNT